MLYASHCISPTQLDQKHSSTLAIFTGKPRKHKKPSHRIFRHMHGVLNEVYLQFFLQRWAVNRETNLMNLFNP